MSKLNRIANCKNEFQGERKRVLCVCSAGLLRSPTAALVLANEPFGFNTRACGATPEFALVPLDEVLIAWADEIVCMEEEHASDVREMMIHVKAKPIVVLGIEDSYPYRDEKLVWLIAEKYKARTEERREQIAEAAT